MTRLTIESVETAIVDLPLRRPHQFSVLTIDHQSFVLVRLRTKEGIEGIGEAVVPGGPWWGGEAVESIKTLIDTYIAPALIGEDPTRVEWIAHKMNRIVAGNPFAKASLETAMYDAWGKAAGQPIYELVGGLYRDSIPVTWALGADDPKPIVEEAEVKLDDGLHSSFKLKMGVLDPDEDVSRIGEIAKALTPRASVRVDLNGAWDELIATRLLPRLEEAGIDLVEQPVPAWNVDGLSRIAAALRIPVMADESLRTPNDALTLAQRRAGDIFAVKIPKSGGFSVARKIAAVAEAAGIPCHGGTTIESSIGTAANLHLVCATPGVTAGSELFGPLLMTEDLAAEPLTYNDGHLHVPHAPGLGVQLDEHKLGRLRRPE